MKSLSSAPTAVNPWMYWWIRVPGRSNITKTVRFVVHRFYLSYPKMMQGKWSSTLKGMMNNSVAIKFYSHLSDKSYVFARPYNPLFIKGYVILITLVFHSKKVSN